jgi:predicted  nucleic acid-binding Zn-ribbon protein
MKKYSQRIKCTKCGEVYEDFSPVPYMLCPQCYTKKMMAKAGDKPQSSPEPK